MKILFVLGQLPYPPRNGVTIPTYNFLTGLAARHDVSLLLIRDGTSESQGTNLKENAALVRDLWELNAPLKPRLARIATELTGKGIYHIGRHYDRAALENLLGENSFDVVWISNSAIFDSAVPLQGVLGTKPVYVAGLNDSLTEGFRGAIRVLGLRGWSPTQRISLLFKWLRSWRLGTGERSLLDPFDVILVQSAKDQHALNRISGRNPDKTMVLSNGVDRSLFSIEQSARSKNLLFIGSLKGYSPLVEWIVTEVWPAVRKRHSDAKFTIIGRGATDSLLSRSAKDERIEYLPFVENIQDIYRGRILSILPVRKASGLINKVVESMAAGIPVVGDAGSFNALPGFQDGTHGIVANDAQSMTSAVLRLMDDEVARAEMATAAKALVSEHFAWETRIAAIEEKLRQLSERPRG